MHFPRSVYDVLLDKKKWLNCSISLCHVLRMEWPLVQVPVVWAVGG